MNNCTTAPCFYQGLTFEVTGPRRTTLISKTRAVRGSVREEKSELSFVTPLVCYAFTRAWERYPYGAGATGT